MRITNIRDSWSESCPRIIKRDLTIAGRLYVRAELVSNSPGGEGMDQVTQFRKLLPLLQTVLAIVFGGWGLWLRNSILSRPFLGDSTGWNSTAVFHVWPWPLKFAMIVNLPALLAGALLAWPLEYIPLRLPEWVQDLPVLLLIPLFWYWVGSWVDKYVSREKNRSSSQRGWILLAIFMLVCGAASSISGYVGGYTSYLLFGIAIWLMAAIAASTSARLRRRKSKIA